MNTVSKGTLSRKQVELVPTEEVTNRYPIFKFDEDNKVQTIDRELIANSLEITDSRGKPLRNRPVQIWTLLDNVEQAINKAGIDHSLAPIYVQRNASNRMLTREEKPLYDQTNTPINKWRFDKIITMFHLHHSEDNEVNAGIAVSFNDYGIQIAFGMNVHVCTNFSILGGQKSFLQTFSRHGLESESYQGILARMEQWVLAFDENRKNELDMMYRMIETDIKDVQIVDRIIGKLYQKAVNQVYGNKEFAPFTISNMSNFVQEAMKKRAEDQTIKNVWDLYNWGTEVIKPGFVDLNDIAISSSQYATFLQQEFSLN